MKQILPIAATLTIAAIFLGFAGDGLAAYFTADDMMNLYGAWFRSLLQEQRPLGALLYREMFAAFGLNPLPYRILCFGLLGANLTLLYAVCARLGGSRFVGALAALLGAYHAHLADLYYSTGTIYDLLCFAFYWGAVLVWLRGERRWLVLPLYAGALLSKEMAVTLPLLLLVCDLAARRRPAWRLLSVMALVTLAFIARNFVGATVNPAYVPRVSWTILLERWQNYASDLFYGLTLTPARVLLLWIVLIAAAALTRRRESAVALAAIWAGLLPIIFIDQRGFYAVYLTLPGWYLLMSLLLARMTPYARPAIVFAAVALLLIPAHAARKEKGRWWVAQEHANVRSVLEAIRSESLPHGAHVLFVNDPFPKEDWILTFIFRLRYRDDDFHVDRVKDRPANPDVRYDRIYRLDDGRLTRL